jgi:hypothetical protein
MAQYAILIFDNPAAGDYTPTSRRRASGTPTTSSTPAP